ncbi:ubiE/COQ5 methyltransferase family protein [Mycobacterium xenopi 4042]|uniref:UbiE/COQ5 methyltransferase family protein n=1 Tax=Mycobacterium xenopi 4042 TaxID=1299334 RepID=X8DMD1_MYCXE|nr:ubiE/COQ5 methyltransferase family protein [Mycobacterium xenopi 4042]
MHDTIEYRLPSGSCRRRSSATALAGTALRRPHRRGIATGWPATRYAGARRGLRPGDVSFVAARLVGSTGTVLGVDAADIVELATSRAAEQGLSNVRFQRSSIAEIALDEPVDAVIGRLILMHLPDPVGALRQLATLVRPGGLIAFSEIDTTAATSAPDLPLLRAVRDGIAGAFTGMGLDPAFGATLHTLFRHAGLGEPRLTLGAPVGTIADPEPLSYVVETWRSLLPVARQLGLATDGLSDVDKLVPRLREEAASADAILVLPALISAWICR